MNDPSLVFILIASIGLFLQFIKDIEFMVVDSRKNFFMMGIGVALAIISGLSRMFLGLSLAMFLFNFSIHKYEQKKNLEIFGDGDKEVMAWIVPGLIVVGLDSVIVFLVSFSALLVFFGVAQKHFKFLKDFVPGMLFICLAFVLGISLV